MSHQYLYTRRDGREEVLHIGLTGTLVNFHSDPGVAAALAEMKRRTGESAYARELSGEELKHARRLAEEAREEFESLRMRLLYQGNATAG